MKLDIPIPLRTDNAVLAYALYAAGVPEFRPPINVYDEPMLKKRGYTGFSLEDAVDAEYAKVIATNGQHGRGRVLYFFERTAELPDLLKAFWEQEQENNKPEPVDIGNAVRRIMAEATGRDPDSPPEANVSCKPMDERIAIVRIICITMTGRIPFVNRWKDNAWLDGSASAKATQSAPAGAKQVSENIVRMSGFEFRQLFQDGKRLETK